MLEKVKAEPDVDMFLFSSLDYVEGVGYFKRAEHERLGEVSTETVADYYRGLLQNGNLEVSAATKIIKKSVLILSDLYFKPGIKGEDNEWIIRVLRSIDRVKIIPEFLYVCRMGRANSITNTIGKNNIVDLLNIIGDAVSYRETAKDADGLMACELCFCSYLWFSALGLASSLSKGDKKELYPLFKKNAGVCKYSTSKKTRMAYGLYRVVGLRITAWVLGKYITRKKNKNLNKSKVGEE